MRLTPTLRSRRRRWLRPRGASNHQTADLCQIVAASRSRTRKFFQSRKKRTKRSLRRSLDVREDFATVDPSFYNELVSLRDTELGLDTPDIGQILYTARTYVFDLRSLDEDPDDDEFGEVRRFPLGGVNLYYDSHGEVIPDYLWLEGLTRDEYPRPDYFEYDGPIKGIEIEEKGIEEEGEAGDLSEGTSRWGQRPLAPEGEHGQVQGTAQLAGHGDHWVSYSPLLSYWQDPWVSPYELYMEEDEPDLPYGDHSDLNGSSLLYTHPWTVEDSENFGTLRQTSVTSVGVGGGAMMLEGCGEAGEGEEVGPGMLGGPQFTSSGVCVRTGDPSPAWLFPPTRTSAGDRRPRTYHGYYYDENEPEYCAAEAVSKATAEGSAFRRRHLARAMDQLTGSLKGRSSANNVLRTSPRHTVPNGGGRLPMPSATPDGDSQSPPWHHYEGTARDRGEVRYSGVTGRREARLLEQTLQYPATDRRTAPVDNATTNARTRNGQERFSASARDSGGGGGRGAVSRQGARVQGSGTYGAVGQVGARPSSVVPARPSARAHRHEQQQQQQTSSSGTRQRQSGGRASVASGSSASSRHGTPAAGNRSSDVEVTDVGVQCYSVDSDIPCSECGRRDFCCCEEQQQQYDQAMPCKASGIPVFQGRGGDGPPPPSDPPPPPPPAPPPCPPPAPPPPRDSPRDEVPPRPSSGAGRGWGGGRRALAGTRAGAGRSPAFCTRRGSFGAGRPDVQSNEEAASGRRRASLPCPGGVPGAPPPLADAKPSHRSYSSDGTRIPRDVTSEELGRQQVSRSDSVSSGGEDIVGSGSKRTNPSPPTRVSSLLSRSVSPVVSPGTPKKTVSGRRRETSENRTPPSTPLARRPPPRALYQVKLSPSASPKDAPDSPKEKPSSKLPTVSSRSTASPNNNVTKEYRNVSSSSQGKTSTGLHPPLKDTTKAKGVPDSPEGMSGVKGDSLKGMSKSLKLDTPPKSLPLSLSLTSSNASTAEGESASNETSLDLSAVSGTLVSDSEGTPPEAPKPTQGLRRNLGMSNLTKSGNSNNNNSNNNNNSSSSSSNNASTSNSSINGTRKANAQLSRGSQQHTRVTGKFSNGSTTTTTTTTPATSRRLADSRVNRSIGSGTSQLKPKTPLARTYSGPKSSLLMQGGGTRGNIVRRVMNGSRTNLNKKKSNSRTSLIVGRHNLYNRSKSGSKGSLLGSRNNLFRSSLDSQRTESTTDSGCNSPLFGSQLSLDGDRRRPGSSSSSDHPRPSSSNASSPTDNLRTLTLSHLPSRRTRNTSHTARGPAQTTTKTRGLLRKGHETRIVARPSTFAPLASPEPDPSYIPDPEDADDKPPSQPPSPPPSPPETPTPPPSYTRSSSLYSSKASLNDTKPERGGEAKGVVQIVHTHSSSFTEERQKIPVSVKRSCSLQLPHEESRPGVPPKPNFLRVDSAGSINSRGNDKEQRRSPDQALPGICVSFRSVSSSIPDDICSMRDSGGDNIRRRIGEKERKEITTVSITNEPRPKLKEEKGVQVEECSSSEEEQEEEEEDTDSYPENSGSEPPDAMGTLQPQRQQASQVHVMEPAQERHRFLKSLSGPMNHHHSATPLSTTTSGVGVPPQFGPERVRKNTIVHITSTPKEEPQVKVDRSTGPEDREDLVEEEAEPTEQRGGGPADAEDNSQLINRLESSLADIIDATVLKNFKINGNILTNQFDAIIATLKKVAASVEAGESAEANLFGGRSDAESGVKGRSRTPSSTPSSPMTPVSPSSISSMSSSSMSPISPSTPKTPSSKNPLSLFSISEGPGHVATPPMPPKTRKLSLPKDALGNSSPLLGDLARRLHANPNHLRADQDFVEFMDLDRPYGDLIRSEASPKAYGRKNSTGSLGLSSCASLMYDNSYYTKPPTSTASATDLNADDDCSGVFAPHWNSFRKVHSISNVTGNGSAAPPRVYQRHLSLEGPDDAQTEHRLRKSLSKSRELLSQLELEYKKIKGEESKSNRNSFAMDGSWLETDFDELVSSLTKGSSSAQEALALLTNNDLPSSSNRSDRTRGSKKDSLFESPGARRQLGQQPHQQGSEGRHIFSFFQKKGRSQSLSGTEAIKISLPTTPEDDPKGTSRSLQEAQDRVGVPGSGRTFRPYESANLDRRGRTNRSNSIPSGSPYTPTGVALPLELIGILKKSRNKSLSKIHNVETKDTEGGGGASPDDERPPNSEEEEEEEGGGGGAEEDEEEEEEDDGKQQRSLSLPKSFLSDKYGLTGIKAALPSVIFPWRRGDPARTSGRSTPYVTTPTSNGPALADASTQSPCATSYTNDQSAAGDASADFAFGDRDATGEVKTKERVWRRSKGGNGVSRSTRKEKANSSPVFRRASLSHSEWDIRRPWSHVYSDREAAKLSQSVCRLAMTSGGEGTSQVDVVPDGGEGGPRSLPFMPASPSSTPEGMFQKFKKSLSLRLAKKAASRSESPGPRSSPVVVAPSGGSDHGNNLETSSATLPRRRGTSSSHKEEDPKPGFLFGHPLFRSSKERRRARLKDARALKCNSGDSGDSGIELVTTLGPAGSSDVTTTPRPSDGDSSNYNGHVMTVSTNLLRFTSANWCRRTAVARPEHYWKVRLQHYVRQKLARKATETPEPGATGTARPSATVPQRTEGGRGGENAARVVTAMSWVLDVSRCLGLVDISSRDIHQPRGPPHAAATAAPASPSPSGASATPSTSAPAKRTVGLRGHNASSPLRRQTKSSTWLLGSPFSRAGHYGPPGGGGGKKMRPIHRSGSRSTPCLMDGEGDDEERGSLVSTPATSSLDSLEVIADSPRCLSDRARDSPRYDSDELGEDSALCPKDSPSPKVTVYSRTSAFRRLTPPSACLMLKDVRSFSCNPGSFLTKSCEVLSPTEAEDSSSTIVTSSSSSNHGGVLVVTDSPARSSSVSHLDCSVSYGTNGTGATPLLVGSGRPAWSEEPSHRNSPRGVFNEARDTLVNRICGAAPPFPSTEHPQRVVRSPRHRFSRSEHTLHRANALLLQQTSSISAGFPERVDSRSSRSGYQKSVSVSALHRPESQRRHSWRRSSSEWSLWAQEVLNSLHDLQERRRARSSTSLPTSASGAGRPLSECSGASSSTFYSHRVGQPH
ncbi:uncharacterized protein LOC143035586 [Oratosquilla oratoria]|uniref:uncharacterized protein LOC143035586 n=1 Tax=Oratosquilla oratoria TaxID=337810 RepID=UPI003F765B9B